MRAILGACLILSRELCDFFAPVAIERQLNQPVEQDGERNSAVLPHFGIHADGGETGDGVDFVDVKLVRRRFERPAALDYSPPTGTEFLCLGGVV